MVSFQQTKQPIDQNHKEMMETVDDTIAETATAIDANGGNSLDPPAAQQQQQQQQQQHERTFPLPKWYPNNPCRKGHPIYYGNPEALAWALDGIGRAVSFAAAGAFLGTALVRLATEAAGCSTESSASCTNRVHGIRPSSLLTTYTMIIGITSTALLPLMGAIIDHTPHRLLAGQVVCTIFTLSLLPQLFLSEHTWFMVAIAQVINSIIGWAQTALAYAYLPELTSNELILSEYTQNFGVTSFGSMLLYLAIVIALASAWTTSGNTNNTNNDVTATRSKTEEDVLTARIGMGIAFVVSAVSLSIAWGLLFQPRPAISATVPTTKPSNEITNFDNTIDDDNNYDESKNKPSLWTLGFRQLFHTFRTITQQYPALKWFYISVAFCDAAVSSLATILITYFTDQLQLSGQENATAILCILVGGIPGAWLANFTTKRLDPLQSTQIALLVLISTTAVFVLLPTQSSSSSSSSSSSTHGRLLLRTYLFSFAWGIGGAWKMTSDRMVASSIIPQKQLKTTKVEPMNGVATTTLEPVATTAIAAAATTTTTSSTTITTSVASIHLEQCNHNAELMGLYLFSSQCLSFLPPIVYTALNEVGISQRIGIATLDCYFLISLLCVRWMGSYEEARSQVARPASTFGNKEPHEHHVS